MASPPTPTTVSTADLYPIFEQNTLIWQKMYAQFGPDLSVPPNYLITFNPILEFAPLLRHLSSLSTYPPHTPPLPPYFLLPTMDPKSNRSSHNQPQPQTQIQLLEQIFDIVIMLGFCGVHFRDGEWEDWARRGRVDGEVERGFKIREGNWRRSAEHDVVAELMHLGEALGEGLGAWVLGTVVRRRGSGSVRTVELQEKGRKPSTKELKRPVLERLRSRLEQRGPSSNDSTRFDWLQYLNPLASLRLPTTNATLSPNTSSISIQAIEAPTGPTSPSP